jgi:bifunctional non-homologous end joining protein LigD
VTDNGRFSYLLGGVREPDGRLRYVGAIKCGYGAEVALGLLPKMRALATDTSPFYDPPRKTSDVHWLRPELIAEVEMAEFTGSGKMRQASFKGLRDDLVGAG